jgi:AraC-like DNA-binding protein
MSLTTSGDAKAMAAAFESEAIRCPHTRMMCGDVDGAPWELWRRTPHPALLGDVLGLWAGMVSSAGGHRVLPNGEVMLMFHLGVPQRLTEKGGQTTEELLHLGFVAGLQEQPATYMSLPAETRVVCARLTPRGAYRLFAGLPQAELTGRIVEIDTVLPTRDRIADLHGRMTEAAHLGDALAILERWLQQRFLALDRGHPATCLASTLLSRTTGAMPVQAIVRESGVSERRLRDLMVREVGVPPKRLARILRFRATLDVLAIQREADFAQVAIDLGYYDQPHMNREFRSLAMMTPMQYLDALGDGLDGVDVVAP